MNDLMIGLDYCIMMLKSPFLLPLSLFYRCVAGLGEKSIPLQRREALGDVECLFAAWLAMRICCAFLLGGGEVVENENEHMFLSEEQSYTIAIRCEYCES